MNQKELHFLISVNIESLIQWKKVKERSLKSCSSSVHFLIRTLTKEIKRSVTEKTEYEIRDTIKIFAILLLPGLSHKAQKPQTSQCSILFKVQAVWLRSWWKKWALYFCRKNSYNIKDNHNECSFWYSLKLVIKERYVLPVEVNLKHVFDSGKTRAARKMDSQKMKKVFSVFHILN